MQRIYGCDLSQRITDKLHPDTKELKQRPHAHVSCSNLFTFDVYYELIADSDGNDTLKGYKQ